MSFTGSLLLLTSLCCGVFVPIIIGHALGSHEYHKLIWVPVYLVLAAIFGFLHSKFGQASTTQPSHHH